MSIPSQVLTIGTEAEWLADILSTRGHVVARTTTVAEALQVIAEHDPDLIVVDAALPMEGALTLCRALRIRTEEERPVVVAVSPELPPARRAEFLLAGAWECVTLSPEKPDPDVAHRFETFIRARRATSREALDSFTDPSTGLYSRIGLSRRARELGAHLFRNHDPLACVVLAFTLRPDSETAMSFCARLLLEEGRISDVIARLAPREVAILAPRTDATGAVRLATRLFDALQAHTAPAGADGLQIGVRGAYEAVPDLGYAPVQPIDLVVRTAATLRNTPPPTGDRWLEPSESMRNRAATL